MKLYFDTVRIDTFPVVWEELEDTPNQLKCCYTLVGKRPMGKQLMLEKLSLIPGVTTDSGEAIINDAESFYRLHPNKTCLSVSSQKQFRNAFFKIELPANTTDSVSTHEESPRIERQHSPRRPPKAITPRAMISPKLKEEPKRGIELDTLIPDSESQATLWRDTVGNEKCFEKKIKKDASLRTCQLIKSEYRLVVELQYKNNDVLGPIKKELILKVRYLFDKILARPFLENFGHEPTLPALTTYFQNAVSGIMVEKPYDHLLTEYENLTVEDRELLFANDAEYQFVNRQARLARANVKLQPLLFFINDGILSTEFTNDMTLATHLDSLRVCFKPLISQIRENIAGLQNLLIELGIKRYECKLADQKLKTAIKERHPSIEGFISFNVLIKQRLKKSLDLESEFLHKKIINDVISMINMKYYANYIAQGQIDPPPKCDDNFYMSTELSGYLALVLGSDDITSLKNLHKSKNWDRLSQIICDKLYTYIQEKLLQAHDLCSFHSMIQSCLKQSPSIKIKDKYLSEIHQVIVNKTLNIIKIKQEDNLVKLVPILVITHNNDDFYLSNSFAEEIAQPLLMALPSPRPLKKSDDSNYLTTIAEELYNQIFEPPITKLLQRLERELSDKETRKLLKKQAIELLEKQKAGKEDVVDDSDIDNERIVNSCS